MKFRGYLYFFEIDISCGIIYIFNFFQISFDIIEINIHIFYYSDINEDYYL